MTTKKSLAFVMCLVMAYSLCTCAYASGGAMAEQASPVSGTARIGMPGFDVPCKNAILVSTDTGEVLYEKAPDEAVPIASITKVMTLILTYEALDSGKIAYTDIVPVSEHAYNMGGSQIWLEPGEQFTVEEMLKAICVSSANDAAVAMAEYVGGSEGVFVEMMNKKAEALGMTNTHFKNACGLDEDGHLSSARDVVTMSRVLLSYGEAVTKYTTIWMDTLRGGATQLTNTNKLLKKYSGISGLKTGTTGKAGVCISASAEREGMKLIAVVLGSSNSADRFTSAMELLDYGFANYETAPFPNISSKRGQIAVKMGAAKEVKLNYAVPSYVLTKKGESARLSTVQTLPDSVNAPVKKDAPIGNVALMLDSEKLAEYPILAADDVEQMSFDAAMLLLLEGLFCL